MRRKRKPISHRSEAKVIGAVQLDKVVGENIRIFREARKLSQGQLAQEIQAKQASISNLEAGKRGFSSNTLYKIAKVLGVHPGVFFFPPLK